MKSIKKLQKIIDELKYDIILGRLRPYQTLVEDSLMARFDAKRHVVRRAIADLVEKGIVIKKAGRSGRVRFFAATEVEQMYSVRVALHVFAIQIMPFPVSPAVLSTLKEYQRQHARSVDRQDLRGTFVANEKFHETLFGACGNPYLIDTIRHYEWLSNPVRSYGIADKDIMMISIAHHKAMISALAHHDRNALKRLVAEHVMPGKEVYLRSLGSADGRDNDNDRSAGHSLRRRDSKLRRA